MYPSDSWWKVPADASMEATRLTNIYVISTYLDPNHNPINILVQWPRDIVWTCPSITNVLFMSKVFNNISSNLKSQPQLPPNETVKTPGTYKNKSIIADERTLSSLSIKSFQYPIIDHPWVQCRSFQRPQPPDPSAATAIYSILDKYWHHRCATSHAVSIETFGSVNFFFPVIEVENLDVSIARIMRAI